MSANAFDTLKAAKSLRAAGFDEAQAEAVVATVGDAVRVHTEPLAGGISTIEQRMATRESVATVEQRMATKEDVAAVEQRMATKEDVAAVRGEVATVADRVETISGTMATKDEVATISGTMATKEYVDAALATLRAEIAVDFRNLYRHLWVMGTGFVGVTVALVKLLP